MACQCKGVKEIIAYPMITKEVQSMVFCLTTLTLMITRSILGSSQTSLQTLGFRMGFRKPVANLGMHHLAIWAICQQLSRTLINSIITLNNINSSISLKHLNNHSQEMTLQDNTLTGLGQTFYNRAFGVMVSTMFQAAQTRALQTFHMEVRLGLASMRGQ